MGLKVAINGLGRIGRCLFRLIIPELVKGNISLLVINSPADVSTLVHLLCYDSTYGRFEYSLEVQGNDLIVAGKHIRVLHERDPSCLPWSELMIDCVLECSGKFNDSSMIHVKSGAKKVLVSAPMKNANASNTIVRGVNDEDLDISLSVYSVGSCTTNCLLPVLKFLNIGLNIESAFFTTIHAYTNDQNLLDNNHKSSLRRARTASLSMVPTTTGASKILKHLIPDLYGKVQGTALRVPTHNVSVLDLVVSTSDDSISDTNQLKEFIVDNIDGQNDLVLNYERVPLVSIDYNGNHFSGVFDLEETYFVSSKMFRVLVWYDNEFAFSKRMLEVMYLLFKK
ncbi:MAG: glyceraldehyde-3-phosphate dehydrogenase, type I [Candidatus Xenolissoclinum pacificiensis L6]|uniref:Glyceraldehyde-3-phosphate dehydrogenase, type I n=1 Tax=Candidatus Xenolissoclinum pacificiensis L6 TaxID=1401685 RepID=W2V1F1_9RICK|nr:MAG: glyceraldehyde-3-phosphate dehydrogenase, type I [Candidatus Xenolissoclinum pacificiensis L6]